MADNDITKPIMPTGSGVADLEIEREQAALAVGAGAPEQVPMDDAAGGPQAEDPNAPVDSGVPTHDGPADTESAAHPPPAER